jgi:hypothetical protein
LRDIDTKERLGINKRHKEGAERSWAWWNTPGIPATPEAEIGGW